MIKFFMQTSLTNTNTVRDVIIASSKEMVIIANSLLMTLVVMKTLSCHVKD